MLCISAAACAGSAYIGARGVEQREVYCDEFEEYSSGVLTLEATPEGASKEGRPARAGAHAGAMVDASSLCLRAVNPHRFRHCSTGKTEGIEADRLGEGAAEGEVATVSG
jgi:hypothetical protein